MRYLPGNSDAKKEVAFEIAARDHIGEGLICVLTAVESRADGFPRAHFGGTIKSNVKRIETGVRTKYWLNSN